MARVTIDFSHPFVYTNERSSEEDDMRFIEEQAVGGAGAASVTFSNIPQTYRHLVIIWTARKSTSGAAALQALLNADSGANYDKNQIEFDNSVTVYNPSVAQTSARLGSFAGSDAPTSAFGSGKIEFPYYATATQDKTALSWSYRVDGGAAADLTQEFTVVAWRTSASGITSINLAPSAGNFVEFSKFSLYGLL